MRIFRKIRIRWQVWRGTAVDIWSKSPYPANVLSNLHDNRFCYDGMNAAVGFCGDMPGVNDQVKEFISLPLPQSYYLGGKVFAGEYPGDKCEELAEAKLKRMHHFGVRHFVDLTEEGELRPYHQLLPGDTTYLRFPIRDVDVPKSVEDVHQLIDKMECLLLQDGYTYIHCWGGVGRTGTIVACYEARQMNEPTLEEALAAMRSKFCNMPKSAHRKSPETQEQIDFVHRFVDSCKQRKESLKQRTKDRIRGSLMAGAAGDALGYTVEFMSRKSILAQYGNKGITKFDLTAEGKALVSDDTQMTLFTACGMLTGVTRGYMRGIGGRPETYVDGAYLDWYYTQTGRKRDVYEDRHYTWLRDLSELAHRRAPGNTCLSACESLLQGEVVLNNSKGCGGIMRVAPMALLMAGYWGRGGLLYNVSQMDEAGAEVAAVTHKHPLAFLPSAMLTHLIYSVIRMEEAEIKASIADISLETIDTLDSICKGKYEEEKRYLADLTRMAVKLASNDKSDAENICLLGEGWTGEEAWAIALYCVVRHIDSTEDAIIAAVNHDGDSDSTGAVCGNIMGAIYGYETMKRKRLFCPQEKELEQTLELSDIILTLADDLYTSCIISENDPIDTPEKQQWYVKYYEMKPVGLKSEIERNGHELKNMYNLETNTLDIRSNGLYPSNVLSNLCSNGFRFDGIICGSMEGFLQSLKRKEPDKQRQICSMKGGNARKMSITSWQTDRIVWWRGQAIDRQSDEYHQLICRAYQAMFEQNERFRTALMQTRGITLVHTSGEPSPYKTILTPSEFCGILMDLRDNYDLRDKTNELEEKSARKKRVFVDMDNVLVDFESGLDLQPEDIKKNTRGAWMKYLGFLSR